MSRQIFDRCSADACRTHKPFPLCSHCCLLAPHAPASGAHLFHPCFCRHYRGQSGLLTNLCPFGFSLRTPKTAISIPPFLSHPPGDLLLMLQPPRLQIVKMNFPFRLFHPVLLWFRVLVVMRFLFRVLCFLVPPPLSVPLFPFVRPCTLVAVADALLVMVNIDLRLLCLLHANAVLAMPRSGHLCLTPIRCPARSS
jgi:hypothetical protein